MEKTILDYLKNDRSFDTGLNLYMRFGESMAFKQTLNRQGFSDYNLKTLYYELSKMAKISEAELNEILSVPIAIIPKTIEVKETKKDDAPKLNFVDIPEEIKKTIKLREEFPFLNSKDCPNELKILVADRITTYHTYVEKHKELFDAATPEEFAEAAASIVDNYIENREIWDELNHYKETGEVLGKHEIFAKTIRENELKAMATGDQIALLNNLKNYIARSSKEVKDNPDADNSEKLEKIDQWKFELSVLSDILKIQAKTDKTKNSKPKK